MTTLNVHFEKAEFRRLLRAKRLEQKNISWKNYILMKCAPLNHIQSKGGVKL
jgi:hypothetical protein